MNSSTRARRGADLQLQNVGVQAHNDRQLPSGGHVSLLTTNGLMTGFGPTAVGYLIQGGSKFCGFALCMVASGESGFLMYFDALISYMAKAMIQFKVPTSSSRFLSSRKDGPIVMICS